MKTKWKIISAASLLAVATALLVNANLQTEHVHKAKAETSADWNQPYTGSYTGTYYNNITATSGKSLQDQLTSTISSGAVNVGYDGLFDVYPDSDARPEDGTLFDMYGDIHFPTDSKKCGNYNSVGDCWNREHSIPKSWWGGNKNEKYSDAHHLLPTDGYVNNWRSNFPLGEVSSIKNSYTFQGGVTGVSKLGTNSVFEPADVYKGDFARIYFYFATRYQGGATSGNGASVFSTSQTNFYLTESAKTLFLKWHKADPVSIKEVNRNNGVYLHQKNRNPFVDHPEYVEAIWEGTPVTTDKVTLSASTLSFAYDSAGAQISATSSDGSQISWVSNNTSIATVSSPTSNSGAQITISPVSAGSTTVTASATINSHTVSASCTVVVTKTLSTLTYTGTPNKTSYYSGQTFDPTGLTVTAKYTDNSTEDVTNLVTWSPSPLTTGTTSVTGSYGGLSVTVNGLTVIDKPTPAGTTFAKVTSSSDISAGDRIVIASYSNKKVAGELNSSYLSAIDASSAFNSDGSKITSLPSNSSVFELASTSDGWTLTSDEGQLYSSANKNVNFSGNGTGTWSISVASGVATISNTNSSYGTIQYNSGSPRFTTYTSGQTSPNIYKQEYSSPLDSIAVTNAKAEYYVGDTFIKPAVTATYEDTTEKDVTDSATYTGYDLAVAGNYTVTVSYSEGGVTKTASYNITVKPVPTVVSLTATGTPSKKTYIDGDTFNPNGLTITATFSDESEEDVTSDVTWTPNPLTEGTTSVTGSYQGQSVNISGITVNPAPFSNSIKECYSLSSGASVTNVYGIYVGGFNNNQSTIIMNGEYGIMLYYTEPDSTWVENETCLCVTTATLDIYKNLYELKSCAVSKVDSAETIANNVLPVSIYSVTGSESTSDLTVANRLCLMSGVVTSIKHGSTSGYLKNTDNTVTMQMGGSSIQLFIKSATATDEVGTALNDSLNNSSAMTIKGFTGFYNDNFQVQFKNLVESSSTYTAANFAQDLLDLTNSICSSSVDKGIALSGVWLTLETDKYYILTSDQQNALYIAVANKDSSNVIEQAMARYDQICKKYDSCNNFIGRATANGAKNNLVITNSSNMLITVVSISIAAISILGVSFLLVKKKKER